MRIIPDCDVDSPDFWKCFMQYIEENCLSWKQFFIYAKPEIIEIAEKLKNVEFYPQTPNIFNAFKFTPLNNIKVVIIGQDPYPNTFKHPDGNIYPNAMGISFSVNEKAKIPASLKTVYQELVNSGAVRSFPKNGNLINWALQGVFMYNTTLTVIPDMKNSHEEIWKKFTRKVLLVLNKKYSKCIYMLWGKQAQSYKTIISKSAVILECCHPSPMATNQNPKNSFIGCNHFNIANKELTNGGIENINWDPEFDDFEFVDHVEVDLRNYLKNSLPKIYLKNDKTENIIFNGEKYAIDLEEF